jgi:hypothetical protein
LGLKHKRNRKWFYTGTVIYPSRFDYNPSFGTVGVLGWVLGVQEVLSHKTYFNTRYSSYNYY